MLARALDVAPSPKPTSPAVITAASWSRPIRRNTTQPAKAVVSTVWATRMTSSSVIKAITPHCSALPAVHWRRTNTGRIGVSGEYNRIDALSSRRIMKNVRLQPTMKEG